MSETLPITLSNMVALWQLVAISIRNDGITVSDAVSIVRSSGLIGGEVPADQGIKLGLHCKFFEVDDQKLILTQTCREGLVPVCDTDEPNTLVTRKIILTYLSLKTQDWLIFFNEDPQLFKPLIPTEWVLLLDGSNLFDFDDDSVREWWSDVFKQFQTYKEGRKIELGKVAEKLTFEWERERISNDGLDSDHKFIIWVSQISDRYGYDVGSVRGLLLKTDERNNKEKIRIEVKSAVSSSTEQFRFFVTKPEWKMALNDLSSYYFYCWVSTNLQTHSATGPFIISAQDIHQHVPSDNGVICEWSECRFVLNLSDFQIN